MCHLNVDVMFPSILRWILGTADEEILSKAKKKVRQAVNTGKI